MSKSTISTFQLFKLYTDQEAARKYLEGLLWKSGAICPVCKSSERITPRKDGYYRCNACVLTFTIRTGTIFERSHVPLHKWLYAMYLLVTARKGISSLQLAKEIGITQKSAWFVLQRLREACGHDPTMLRGTVEVDEVYIGGKEGNKHMKDRMYGDRGVPEKNPVIGLRERGGRTKAVLPKSVGALSLASAIRDNVELGSTIHTDEFAGYQRIEGDYGHRTVNHQNAEYACNGATVNGIESVFAVLKRGLHGVYHHASKKHLKRYVDEFTWRLNEGNVERHTLKRLDSFVDAVAGQRLTYQRLTS